MELSTRIDVRSWKIGQGHKMMLNWVYIMKKLYARKYDGSVVIQNMTPNTRDQANIRDGWTHRDMEHQTPISGKPA